MAREAGILNEFDTAQDIIECGIEVWLSGERGIQSLDRFADLVRADERNRTWTQEHWTEYERSIVAAEREACAKVCDEQVERSLAAVEKTKRTTDHRIYRAAAQTATWNAAAIRARGNT
jgi:hypothetical protein